MVSISAAAEKLIIDEEVGSPGAYEKRYRHPEWPGGASGITVGIGYDVGYTTHARLKADWSDTIADDMISALDGCVGATHGAAHDILGAVRGRVDISFAQAMKVFDNVDKPRWLGICRAALPNFDKLGPDCAGAIMSLTYNRGASYNMSGDRYREMAAIKVHMINQQFDKIPAEFRSMKRLWNNGLVGRREREAQLFERGLAIMKGTPEQSAPKASTRQQEVQRKAATAGTVGGTAGGGTATAVPKPVAAEGHHGVVIAAAIIVGFVLAAGISLYLNRHQRLPKADPVAAT